MPKILQQLQQHLRQSKNEFDENNESIIADDRSHAHHQSKTMIVASGPSQISVHCVLVWSCPAAQISFDLFTGSYVPQVLPRLPWELERLVSAAGNSRLPTGTIHAPSGMITNLENYVLSWTAAYVCGATSDASSKLWEAWSCWQGNKLTA
jgi:hypothetical protein